MTETPRPAPTGQIPARAEEVIEPLALVRPRPLSGGPGAGASEQVWTLASDETLRDEVDLVSGAAIDRLVESVRTVGDAPGPDPPRVVIHEGSAELMPRRFSIQVYRQAWHPVADAVPVLRSSARLRRRRAPAFRLDGEGVRVGRLGLHEATGRLRAPWSPIGIRARLTCYDLAAARTRLELWPVRRRPVLQWRRYLAAGIAVMEDVVAEIDGTERASGPQRGPRTERASGPQRGPRTERASGPERGPRTERASGPERGPRTERASGSVTGGP
jgi:hypothetical protein